MMSHNLVVIFHKMYLQQSECIVVLVDDQILTQIFKCCNRQKSFKAPIKSITCRILTRSKQVINISRCNFVNIFPALNKQFGVEMEFTASLKLMQGKGQGSLGPLLSMSVVLTEYFVGLMVHS